MIRGLLIAILLTALGSAQAADDAHKGHRGHQECQAKPADRLRLGRRAERHRRQFRASPFTSQSIQSMLDRMGVNIRSTTGGNNQVQTKNTAAVIVTAELPAFAAEGSRIDVTVSSLGNATSLAGGTLMLTPLSGADNVIYAAAQGPVSVSGFQSSGRAETLTQGVPTAGRIANGALVERKLPARTGKREILHAGADQSGFRDRHERGRCHQCLYARALQRPRGTGKGFACHHAVAAAWARCSPVHSRDRRTAG